MTAISYIINKKILFNYKECYLSSTESSNREAIGSNPSGLLLYLIKNQGNTVTIDEISNYFMVKGRVVNATTAIQYISKLRRALKSLEENKSVIETIKGGGYYIPSDIDIIENSTEYNVTSDSEGIANEPFFGKDDSHDIYQKFGLSKRNGIAICIFIALLIFITELISFTPASFGEVDYRMEKIIKGCNIYVEHDFPEKGSNAEIRLMKDTDLFCHKNKFAYLTYFEHSNNYSIIFCKASIYKNRGRDICSTLSRLGID
ncbi:winged helix-turn-helix domain-containing protein [Klebsiella aerogenes]|uniref:winged helix-turn-helix domain-containing protein n=1 Tax=Klebsiella aerogenes TaxID=548 RepID=UPI0019030575|nr:helix-turn-helix domain-containing protein [Klebsiella aerogenes]MBK0469521.1 winged helix-turn-helix domain-containing protein [Klebsiella aerogenes]HBU8526146.1 winged helix-turn-helix domain-containing protein [Klebsiella aerogenes]